MPAPYSALSRPRQRPLFLSYNSRLPAHSPLIGQYTVRHAPPSIVPHISGLRAWPRRSIQGSRRERNTPRNQSSQRFGAVPSGKDSSR